MYVLALFLILIVAAIVYNFYSIIRAIINYFFKDFINKHLLFRNLKPQYKSILQSAFTYYKNLNTEDQLLFEKRVQKFIAMKEFNPRGGLPEITPEMKTLIAASAIQITFGFPSIYFSHFWRILVYPDIYESSVTHKMHQGEINLGGLIVLSWKNFVTGYLDDTDGRNLGLHEMAHALRVENGIVNEEYDFLDPDALKAFSIAAREEINKMAAGTPLFFRSYAATNEQEFFAVAVENFFERPAAFRDYSPSLYQLTANLLQQNPLAKKG